MPELNFEVNLSETRPASALRTVDEGMPHLVRGTRRFASTRIGSRNSGSIRGKETKLQAVRTGVSVEERPAKEGKVRLQVRVSGTVTQRAYESAIEELGSAVQFPGFRKKKKGKSDPLPRSLVLQVIGDRKVKQFTVDGLIIEVVCDYAQEKGYQVNSNLSASGVVENIHDIRVSYTIRSMILLSM